MHEYNQHLPQFEESVKTINKDILNSASGNDQPHPLSTIAWVVVKNVERACPNFGSKTKRVG
jgi:hypothetical protein